MEKHGGILFWDTTMLFVMDFSLLSMGEFLFKRNEPMRNTKPPAMRVRIDCYTKKSPFRYNVVVQATLQKGKVIPWRRRNTHLHIRNGCANITSSSHLSIDEKLFIINTELT